MVAGLLIRIADETVSSTGAKEVLVAMWDGEGSADDIIDSRGLRQMTDSGALEEAVEGYGRAIEAAARHGGIHLQASLHRGFVLVELGRLEAAAQDAATAERGMPTSVDPWLLRAEIAAASDDAEAALGALREAQRRGPLPPAMEQTRSHALLKDDPRYRELLPAGK